MPRNPEQIIASAIATGRIPKSRAKFYRDMAAHGTDLAFMDTLAAAPGIGELAADLAQADEDETYEGLFGADPGGRARAHHASGPQATEDQLYDFMFGPRPDEPPSAEYSTLFPDPGQQQAAVDASEAAATKAVGALSDMELYREMFGEDPK